MLVAVTALRTYLDPGLPDIVRTAMLVAAGAMTYCSVMFLFFRPLVTEILSLFHLSRVPVA